MVLKRFKIVLEIITVYMSPLDPQVVVAPLFLFISFTPHLGVLDPVICKEAAFLHCVLRSIRPTSGGSATLFLIPFYTTCGSFGPGNMQEAVPVYWVYKSIKSRMGFDYPKKLGLQKKS